MNASRPASMPPMSLHKQLMAVAEPPLSGRQIARCMLRNLLSCREADPDRGPFALP
jgi:hypothetical protein